MGRRLLLDMRQGTASCTESLRRIWRFLHHDRISSRRGHKKGECAASECTLLCNDFLRLGYSQFVVDPNVRLAYTHRDAADVHKPQFVKGIRKTDWADVQSSPPINWSLTPHRPYYKCAAPLPSSHMRMYTSL